MGKSILLTDNSLRLARMQEESKKRYSGYVEKEDVRCIVKKNPKSTVVKILERKVKPEPEPVVEKVVPVYVRPKFMETNAEKHFLLAMQHIGVHFYRYVPAKPKKIKKPKVRKRMAQLDPITGKKMYNKNNKGPEKEPIVRPPAVYSNQSIYDKYNV